MSEIDPITLSVLAGRMEQIADEMDATLFRAAFNPIIAEAHDASHGLYHAVNGDTLVQWKPATWLRHSRILGRGSKCISPERLQ